VGRWESKWASDDSGRRRITKKKNFPLLTVREGPITGKKNISVENEGTGGQGSGGKSTVRTRERGIINDLAAMVGKRLQGK